MNTFLIAVLALGTTALASPPPADGKPPQAFGIFYSGRLVVEGVHDDSPQVREQALRMGVNIFVYALGQAAS